MIEVWKKEEGYLTMEAAFLVTFVFLLAFVILLTGLYICDLNQAKSFLNRRVTELSLNEDSYGEEVAAEDKSRIKKQLFVTDLTEFYIQKTQKEVRGSLKLSMRLDIPIIGNWFGSVWTDRFSLTVDVGDNVNMIRRWEQLE